MRLKQFSHRQAFANPPEQVEKYFQLELVKICQNITTKRRIGTLKYDDSLHPWLFSVLY